MENSYSNWSRVRVRAAPPPPRPCCMWRIVLALPTSHLHETAASSCAAQHQEQSHLCCVVCCVVRSCRVLSHLVFCMCVVVSHTHTHDRKHTHKGHDAFLCVVCSSQASPIVSYFFCFFVLLGSVVFSRGSRLEPTRTTTSSTSRRSRRQT